MGSNTTTGVGSVQVFVRNRKERSKAIAIIKALGHRKYQYLPGGGVRGGARYMVDHLTDAEAAKLQQRLEGWDIDSHYEPERIASVLSFMAKRVAFRFASRVRWKKNTAEGKHTRVEISKGRTGWSIEVLTNWTSPPHHLDTDGTIYKADAKEMGEEMVQKWDREIERLGREQFE